MIIELASALKTQYGTLLYNGSNLNSYAPLFFGVAPDKQNYPFVSYYILDTRINKLTTCTDGYDFFVQFSVFDRGTTPITVMAIQDVIIVGFREIALMDLDGTLINLEPIGCKTVEMENDEGHMGVVEYRAFIEKVK